jgi:hypothetical protein
MKKQEVKIGKVYMVKVSNNVVPVKITEAHHVSGWHGKNMVTGRAVRIKSAARLRYECLPDATTKFLNDSIPGVMRGIF